MTLIDGAIAQLGERLHGMQEVSGSIPLSSTSIESLQKYLSPYLEIRIQRLRIISIYELPKLFD